MILYLNSSTGYAECENVGGVQDLDAAVKLFEGLLARFDSKTATSSISDTRTLLKQKEQHIDKLLEEIYKLKHGDKSSRVI